MYVAVKGGEAAIDNAHRLLAETRRGDPAVPDMSVAQIREQMRLLVDRVMTEGSLYDPDLAALALKQARGDVIEAVFLVRAYRTTLPRLGATEPVDTGAMTLSRRISATFKDLPGGQVLGPTFDYTHRLVDFSLGDGTAPEPAAEAEPAADAAACPRVTDLLGRAGLLEPSPEDLGAPIGDLTREPVDYPADRAVRLQALARGDEGFILALGYSTQRGYGRTHPFVGEIRVGAVELEVTPEELGFSVGLGSVDMTECQMINQFHGNGPVPPQFTRGYGLVFGQGERKAMAMALVDRSLRAAELGEAVVVPAQDQEFVLAHCDSLQATGFVEHMKLPHYVDFQAELDLVRRLRAEHGARALEDPVQREAAE
ncbi:MULTISPECIES: carbon-phosphorus lyase complex subunit PhnI [unclassified Methylobacterium]|uniref:carbon-phosphorus lyase complex subunit PhnI n=1 Tax=unclassified Methylobacterium TaxID=2615210 RepID=UPI0006FB648A|nr:MULTISPECIES: carbon-phosphorus lyase complex subunit PhnI [unclassified Methylobacterium]KQP59727.1 carbon-phosphorus lyase complex subunit PhnI [Methylobacterium sp. Leaf108]KQT86437.1 carbon-phosphorus lyase complex subunit PhnI [Methylobacterium sp. Leaf466]